MRTAGTWLFWRTERRFCEPWQLNPEECLETYQNTAWGPLLGTPNIFADSIRHPIQSHFFRKVSLLTVRGISRFFNLRQFL